MTNYYVSATGSSGNNGLSTGAPKQTIAQVVAIPVVSGDIINIMSAGGDVANLDTATTVDNVTIQNNGTDNAAISRAHGGASHATNAGSVLRATSTSTGWTIRRNPLGGSLTIKHTGTPSASGYAGGSGYLAVGNANLSYAGIELGTGCTGWNVTDVDITHIFGKGIRAAGNNLTVTRGHITDNAVGIYSSADGLHTIDVEVADNGYMLRDGTETNTGANGFQFDGASNWLVEGGSNHGNWSRTGSKDYGAEGGAWEYFDIPDGQGGRITGVRVYENHNNLETGLGSASKNGGGSNARVDHCIFCGKNDYQDVTSGITQAAGGTSGTPNPTGSTSYMLWRSFRDTLVDHCLFDFDDGSPQNSGIRTDTSYDGLGAVRTGNTFRDCIIRNHFDTPTYNFNSGDIPASTTISNNLIYYLLTRGSAGSGNVVAGPGTTHDYSMAEGPDDAFAGAGICAGDVWGDVGGFGSGTAADPKWVSPDNADPADRDYHLQAISPARGMASDGGDVGPYPYTAPAMSYLWQDTFPDTTAGGWGTADSGQAYDYVNQTKFNEAAGLGTITPTASGTHYAIVQTTTMKDGHIRGQVSYPSLPSGADLQIQFVQRGTPDTDWFAPCLRITTAGAVQGQFLRRAASTQVSFSGPTSLGLATFVGGNTLLFDAHVWGTNPTNLSLKVWYSTDTEPSVPQLTATDADANGGPLVAARFGIRYQNNNVANLGVLSFDNLVAFADVPNFDLMGLLHFIGM